MATKTVNLKMVLDRSDKPEAKELRQALWTTHEQVNKAVAEIERILLLCRGRAYWIKDKDKDGKDIDIEFKAEDVPKRALAYIKKHKKINTNNDAEIIKALQQLYEILVPSVLLDKKGEPLKGDSQSVGNSFARPLMRPDPKEGPFPDIAQKILPKSCESWIEEIDKEKYIKNNTDYGKCKIQNTEIEYFFKINNKAAQQWAKNEEGQAFIESMNHLSGAKNRWFKVYKDNDSAWPMLLAENHFEMKQEPRIFVREILWKKLSLLPLISMPFADFKWNSLALRLAVAHLLTWESWNHRCAKEYAKLSGRVNEKETTVRQIDANIIHKIEKYEALRQQELKKNSLANDGNEFKINPRMLRALDHVKEAWSKKNCATSEARKEVLAKLQTELRGKFGDPDFYLWLANDNNTDIWRHEDNPLFEVAQLNALKRLLKRRKKQSLFTQPDAVRHPKWAQFEAQGGTNLKNYKLIQCADGSLSLKLPLLSQTDDGIREKEYTIGLARSGQINDPAIINGDNSKLTFFYADEQYTADMGGSDILFDRPFLEHREIESLRNGEWGEKDGALRVWFKLVLDIEPKPAKPEWLKKQNDRYILVTPPAINHFKSSLLNKKHKDIIEAGLRVLTVDLGIRTFASCSVFELVKGRPEKGLYWLADKEKDLWARHERSFILSMPGDDASIQAQTARYQAYEELSRLKQGKNFIRNLLRLSIIEDIEKRTKELDLFRSGKEKFTGKDLVYKLSSDEIAVLTSHLQRPLEVWKVQIKAIFDKYEEILSNDISNWRITTRPKTSDRQYEMGKSYWGIEYLDDVRDFLKGWSTHAREYGQINRWDRERQGKFANNLLNHINNKKEDRIKTGADLIIQSARGKVYNKKKNKWEDKFQPCRMILFEDLAMYRFRTDRPRRENSQLMRWSHRAIYNESIQQAAIYGIHIDTTGAGFSSKFYARNGCPGIRAKKLTRADLNYINNNEHIKEYLGKDGFCGNLLKEGNIIPWQGGEYFVGFSTKGKLEILHADINAAQNLQRRFWTRYIDTFRLPVTQIDKDGNEWLLQSCGERIKGGLSLLVGVNTPIKFVKAEDGSFKIEKITGKKPKAIDENEDTGLDEFAEELMEQGIEIAGEEGKGKAVFFRDASGLILRNDRFYDSKEFWGRVHRTINKALKEKYEEPNPF
jgi:hypothetical protein